jgi:hypothetical protein
MKFKPVESEIKQSLDDYDKRMGTRVFLTFFVGAALAVALSLIFDVALPFPWRDSVVNSLNRYEWMKYGFEIQFLRSQAPGLLGPYLLCQVVFPPLVVVLSAYWFIRMQRRADTTQRHKFALTMGGLIVSALFVPIFLWMAFVNKPYLKPTSSFRHIFRTPLLFVWISLVFTALTVCLVRVLLIAKLEVRGRTRR